MVLRAAGPQTHDARSIPRPVTFHQSPFTASFGTIDCFSLSENPAILDASRMNLHAVIFTLALALTALADPPPSTLTRKEAIATAERYLLMKWTPTEKNILHGNDANGIRVDTPDTSYLPTTGKSRLVATQREEHWHAV